MTKFGTTIVAGILVILMALALMAFGVTARSLIAGAVLGVAEDAPSAAPTAESSPASGGLPTDRPDTRHGTHGARGPNERERRPRP